MNAFVRYCGNESSDRHNSIFNHDTKNHECIGRIGESEKLATCYRNSIAFAEENGCKSTVVPSISSGVYGYPIEDAAKIAVREVEGFLAAKVAKNGEKAEGLLCCLSSRDKMAYEVFGNNN